MPAFAENEFIQVSSKYNGGYDQQFIYNDDWCAPVDFSLWMENDGTLSITGYTGSGDTVIIPEKISVYSVNAIESNAFAGQAGIVRIQIPGSITRIEDSAFDQPTLDVLCEKGSYAHEWAEAKGYTLFHCCFTPDYDIQEAVPPGCYETGLSEGRYCKNCSTVLAVPEVIPAAGHTVILESNVYETVTGSIVEIPVEFSCSGVCGMQAYWCDLSEQSVMVTENAVVTYQADESGVRILEMWIGEEKNQSISCAVVVHASERMTLPAALKEIDEEAFVGLATREFILPDGTTGIASRAFAECEHLEMIIIPDSVINIADDAFEGSDGVMIICSEGSAAAAYAERLEIPYIAKYTNKHILP